MGLNNLNITSIGSGKLFSSGQSGAGGMGLSRQNSGVGMFSMPRTNSLASINNMLNRRVGGDFTSKTQSGKLIK